MYLINKNEKFGKWTILSESGKYKAVDRVLCSCECGIEKTLSAYSLVKGESSACKKCSYKKDPRIEFGEKFGSWKYLGEFDRINGKLHLLCECDCGEKKFVSYTNLAAGLSKRCPSCKGSNTRYDIKNQKFGRLYVLENTGVDKRGATLWRCLCDCGNEITTLGKRLVTGRVKSCGCYQKELITQLGKDAATHGMSKTKTFMIWTEMKQRCTYKNHKRYKDYGGRGVKIDQRWLEKRTGFVNFLDDMGECPEGYSIERIDVNGNYEKSNCVWIPRENQSKNTRNTYKVEINGEILCLADACRILDVKYNVTHAKIRRGIDIKTALGIT